MSDDYVVGLRLHVILRCFSVVAVRYNGLKYFLKANSYFNEYIICFHEILIKQPQNYRIKIEEISRENADI